jgi:hypothetical protein
MNRKFFSMLSRPSDGKSRPHYLGAAPWPLIPFGLLICPVAVSAQTIDIYFPTGIYGYDQQLGVTVQSRDRPLYTPLGIQVDNFIIQPGFSESLFYNSDVNGNGASGTWGSQTAASIAAASQWSRNSLSASVGVSHEQYFSIPGESYTNWNVGISGGYSIADSQLIAAYSHQSYYQLGTSIGTVRSAIPINDLTDTARLEYTFNFGRVAITPDLSASAYRYGPATISGVSFNQNFLNNNVLAAGVTTRLAINDASGLLIVMRGANFSYISPQAGQPSNDSDSFLLLAGIDYQPKGVWRYRFLVGLEVRAFAASQYATRTAPDVEASLIWSPTELTTVTGTVASTIESPQVAGTSSYTLTQAHFVVDHELRRNIILEARSGVQYAKYAQTGGTQTNLTAGASATWLLERRVALSLDYDLSKGQGSGGSNAMANPDSLAVKQFSQHVIALTLRLAL